MEEFKDKFGNKIRLSDGHWQHVIKEHPEIAAYKKRFGDVLLNPDLIKRSKRDSNTFLYYKYYKDIYKGKYLLVVARIEDKSLLTCYITDRIKEGDSIWEKN